MTLELPALPYVENALEPYYSAKTIGFHYGKHHKAYVDNLNKLVAGSDFAGKSLEETILASTGNSQRTGIFNNAAQVWNHTFFWHSMRPGGGGKPQGEVAGKLEQAFGGYEKFAEQFKAAAIGRFGSGWAWLVTEGETVKIVSTANADTPMTSRQVALLTVDVWEHAYYLDYQNRRPDFVQAFPSTSSTGTSSQPTWPRRGNAHRSTAGGGASCSPAVGSAPASPRRHGVPPAARLRGGVALDPLHRMARVAPAMLRARMPKLQRTASTREPLPRGSARPY